MPRYRFVWKDGGTAESVGETPAAALRALGYRAGNRTADKTYRQMDHYVIVEEKSDAS